LRKLQAKLERFALGGDTWRGKRLGDCISIAIIGGNDNLWASEGGRQSEKLRTSKDPEPSVGNTQVFWPQGGADGCPSSAGSGLAKRYVAHDRAVQPIVGRRNAARA
jgi:hypothetical protein